VGAELRRLHRRATVLPRGSRTSSSRLVWHRRGHGDEHPPHTWARCSRRHPPRPQPEATVADLMRFIPGPDFPPPDHPGRRDPAGLRDGARTSWSGLAPPSSHPKTERESIVVTRSLPGEQGELVEHIASWSGRSGSRASPTSATSPRARDAGRHRAEARRVSQVVLNNLYQHTALQTGFGVILLSIDGASRGSWTCGRCSTGSWRTAATWSRAAPAST